MQIQGDDSMFTQSVHSSLEIAFPAQAAVNPVWCGDNPNVDRSGPPPAKKKAKKKKTVKTR